MLNCKNNLAKDGGMKEEKDMKLFSSRLTFL